METNRVEINITEIHIRAAQQSQRWNPAEIAILQQTTFLPVGYLANRIQLMDEQGVEYTCDMPATLVQFLERFRQGAAVLPGTFTLGCVVLN